MVLPEQDGEVVRELLKEQNLLEHRQVRLPDGEVLVRILLDAQQSEAVLDLLDERHAGGEDTRVVILPVADAGFDFSLRFHNNLDRCPIPCRQPPRAIGCSPRPAKMRQLCCRYRTNSISAQE